MIKVSADALLGVIEDILDFSKIEAGMLQVDPITFEVGQVFGDAVKAMALRAHQKGLELVYHVSPGRAGVHRRRSAPSAAGGHESARQRDQVHGAR